MKKTPLPLLGTISLFLLTCLHLSAAEDERVGPISLSCEYRENPVGIDVTEPHLSWKLHSDLRGARQTAYHILVASTPDQLKENTGDRWDSGKVASDQSIYIPYAGEPLRSKMECYWKVRVWNKDGTPGKWSETARWTMGLLQPDDWTGQWISAPSAALASDGDDSDKKASKQAPAVGAPGIPAPWLRKEFELSTAADAAYVTVHSPGYFELHINGSKVGEDVLTPAVSNLDLKSFTVTYDVSNYLQPGRNCLGLWLGQGWADRLAVRAQLDAVVGGESLTIGTDTTWETHSSGYYKIGGRKWGDFGGEKMDARERIPNWSRPGLDTGSWQPAIPAAPQGGIVAAQLAPLNRIGKEIQAVSVTEESDQYVIDFGTALTGWVRIQMPPMKSGQLVELFFADTRREKDLPFKGKGEYQFFKQHSQFISGGKIGEVFENKFNYAGFRYVVIKGLPSALRKEDAVALLVESDLAIVGAFDSSNQLLNRIHAVNQWTQRCLNLGGYFVDCPHRERMGYGGDGQVALEGFMTNFQSAGYYRKWIRDWRLRQQPNGNLPHMAPFGKGGGGPPWSGALSALTWRHYLYYADKRVLEENYEAIRRHVDYIETLCEDGILRKFGGKWDFLGDWVPPGRGMDTNNWPEARAAELFNNCYRIIQMELLTQMAAILSKPEDLSKYSERLEVIRPLVHAAFYDAAEKHYVIDEQAYYIMPLMSGVTPKGDRAALLRKLEDTILLKNQGHLDTGKLGTYFMMEYLREIGRSDLVYTMFSQTSYPGWGYMLERGATTYWEQWNGYYSQIHACFTSADNWLYQGLAGIQADPEAPGFKNVIIKPAIVGDLTWVKAHHDSPYGRIVSSWQREDDRLTMEVTIPANASATVYVPAKTVGDIRVNGQMSSETEHVTFLGMEKESAVFAVDAGRYQFTSTRQQSQPTPQSVADAQTE